MGFGLDLKFKLRRALPIIYDLEAVTRLLFEHRALSCECTCCGKSSRFRLYGLPPRLNALCANCGSLERHRLQQLLLNARPNLYVGKEILHFAPEPSLRAVLKDKAKRYIACDWDPNPPDIKINIEQIDLPSASFDLIVCHQVLEHVDDRKALPELKRILKSGGVALLSTPVIEGWAATYENPAITSPANRLIHFGQRDHLRYFGRDVRNRISEAGFSVEDYTAVEPAVHKHGLLRGETIFVCT
jgi:SAM-dependent methyltransferase